MTATAIGGSMSAPADRDFVAEYASRAPLALALERSMECQMYVGRRFERPILDIGCGDGSFIEVLFGSGNKVDFGIDLDPRELDRSRQRGVYVRLLQAYAERIPLPDGSMGTVMSNSTLEHVGDLEGALRDISRVLRPGGRLYITVPTDKFDRYALVYRLLTALRLSGAAERFRRFYNRFWKQRHFFPPAEWRHRLERVGLEVEDVTEYASPLRCTIHDLLVPAAFPAFLAKKATGRYFLLPILRRFLVRVLRRALPRNERRPVPQGAGGLVFLVARKPDR